MKIFGVLDLSCPVLQAVLALLAVGALTFIAVLKLYLYLSCGYYRERTKMDGKTVIITGANGGIGRETARELAKRGARVIMGCRNLKTGEEARNDIISTTKNENVVLKKLDVSSFKSIREFAEDILKTEQKLDVLIHNAGTAEKKVQKTEDDIELTMATNHFGPFLLTHLLIDLLKRSAPSRVVVVASELYRLCSVNLENLNPSSSWFTPYLYYVSKYCNIYTTQELARRLEGTNVTANCLHPGMIDTGIWRNVPVPLNWPLKLIVKAFFKTPVQGCQTSVFLACSPDVDGVTGRYFVDCKERNLTRNAMDMNKAKKLWELSEELVKLRTTDPKI